MGTPNWAGAAASAIRSFVRQNKEKLPQVAFFCTQGSSGAGKVFQDLENECGKKPLSTLVLRSKEVAQGLGEKSIYQFIKQLK